MAAAGAWLYEKTGTGTGGSGGGGGDITPAPKAVISRAEVRDVYDGKVEVKLYYTVPGATADNYRATAIYLEDPDLSADGTIPLDGSTTLGGTNQLSGNWNPIYELDSVVSPAVVLLKAQAVGRKIRMYAATYGPAANAKLTRANKPSPTPSLQIDVPASAGQYVSGQEFAWLVTDASVVVENNFENPTQPTYHLRFNYTPPVPKPLPPGMQEFGGVRIIYEYPNPDDAKLPGLRAEGPFLDVHKTEAWVSDEYPAAGGSFKVWFASVDVSSRVNTVVPGITPMVEVEIETPEDELVSPPIGDLVLSNSRHEFQPDGTIFAMADLTWTNPDSVRFSGAVFYRAGIETPYEMARTGIFTQKVTLQVIDFPRVAEDWIIVAIAYDANGKLADDPANSHSSPFVIWHIGPPTNAAPLGSAGAVTIEQELGSDGVVRMRQKFTWTNPADNKFGGMSIARIDNRGTTWWDAPGPGDATLTTGWEPAPSAQDFTYYFISRTPQGVRNQIQPGITPSALVHFAPMEGDIQISRMPEDWWNPAEFDWPTYPDDGGFLVKLIVSEKIFVNKLLRVGGGTANRAASFAGNQNGQIAVFNASNDLRGWIGQQDATGTPDNPAAHTIHGAWFSELYVGGDGPPHAPLYARQDGVVIIGGFELFTNSPYAPYISIRRNDNIEVGRIGARIARNPNNLPPLVPNGDPADIAGAWFTEFAVGGTNLSDWRILSRRDTSGGSTTAADLVNLRNINKFTIDWIMNAPSATNPTNAATSFALGLDAFVADSPSASYWKFPGLTIKSSGSTPTGSALISRGLVLNGPTGRLGAFNTFNGVQTGADGGTFWCELSMNSPVSTQVNVLLQSGGSSIGHAYFSLRDASSNQLFEVVYGNAVLCAQGVRVPAFTVIDANGNLQSFTYSVRNLGVAIDSSGNVTGATFATRATGTVIDANANMNAGTYTHRGTGTVVVDSTAKVTGGGFDVRGYGAAIDAFNNHQARGYAAWNGGGYNNGVSGSFTSANGKTVTVTLGIITNIV